MRTICIQYTKHKTNLLKNQVKNTFYISGFPVEFTRYLVPVYLRTIENMREVTNLDS